MDAAPRHRLLDRQLRRYLPDELRDAPELAKFLGAVNDAYVAADDDRAMLERSLEESSRELYVANSELRAIFQSLPDSLLTLDPSGVILDAKGGELDVGVDARALIGTPLAQYLEFDDPSAFETALGKVRETMTPGGEGLEARSLGNTNEFAVRVMPLSRETVLAVITEVTDRRRYERELRAARDAAEAAARAKSEFLATMSHEIRTPLNGVIGMTGVLTGTRLEEDQREYLRIINNSSEALLSLINDILDFSKIEADCMELEISPFSPIELVEEALELLSEAAGRKGLELCAMIDDDVPNGVEGDPGRLRQVLVNLVSNAIKFTENGSVTLELSARREAAKTTLEFSVTDSGIGIPQDVQGRLFDPFTQADSSTTRRFGGTGLGLAICDRLVKLMGGRITLHSAPGEGARFDFGIRVRESDVAVPSPLPTGEIRELSILCVDDSEVNRMVLRHQLRHHVARIDTIASGQEALRMSRAWEDVCPYDLWIIDMDMPELDGAELARAVRAAAWGRDVPILLLSSVDSSAALARARSAGVDAILRKPARRSLLIGRIAALTSEANDAARDAPPDLDVSIALEGKPPSVLVAEDNPINQRVARVMLTRLGCRVHVVGNGLEALDAIERTPCDVVLMDCQMPEMDGLEATRVLREREAAAGNPRTLVIALTANTQEDVRERCLDAGMDDYLSKPVRLEELRELLERYAFGRASNVS